MKAADQTIIASHAALSKALNVADPVLDDSYLRAFWEMHVLKQAKGRQPPKAIFAFGALSDVAMARLEARDGVWSKVANRVLMPTDVITHWEPGRRQAIYALVDHLGRYIRRAEHIAPGNICGKEWRAPLLLTEAPSGLTIPLGLLPSDEGILIRSLIAPVSPHRLSRLRRLDR